MYPYLLALLASLSLIYQPVSPTTYTPCAPPTLELQIRNRLALFGLALDIDDFTLLSEVFTSDVMANFGPTPTYNGLAAVEAANEYFKNVTTQIVISNIFVNCTDQQAPQSLSYFTANNFINDTQLIVGHGKYYDQWVEESAGTWKIHERKTTLFVSVTFMIVRPLKVR